jgi:hypothetical protein
MNDWYYADAGNACLQLRRSSETARYECQAINAEDAKDAIAWMQKAFQKFEAWEQRQAG